MSKLDEIGAKLREIIVRVESGGPIPKKEGLRIAEEAKALMDSLIAIGETREDQIMMVIEERYMASLDELAKKGEECDAASPDFLAAMLACVVREQICRKQAQRVYDHLKEELH